MRNNTANDKEKYFRVPVYYQVCEYVTVKADDEETARQWVEEHQDKIPTHLTPETSYIDESFEVEQDPNCVYPVDPNTIEKYYSADEENENE